MEVSVETIRRNFQAKADTELLQLAASAEGMTFEARYLLLQELQCRLAKAKEAHESVQLVHGWYTVVAPITDVKFPDSCPRCCRSGAGTMLRFESLSHRKFRLFYWKNEKVVSAVPHCSDCTTTLKRTRAVCSWASGGLILFWLAISIWFRIGRLLTFLGFFVMSLPIAYLYDRTSAVRLGHYGQDVVEYRFRSHQYAKAFASMNNVQAENAETLQSQLEEAISLVR